MPAVVLPDESLAQDSAASRRWGAPSWQNYARVSTYTAMASGELSTVTTDMRRVTGRQPLSLQEFLVAPYAQLSGWPPAE